MTTEQQLSLADLVPGDVLVMQGPQEVSWVEIIADADLDAALIQAIMWLTNSDVCHGAIYYGLQNNTHSLIDDGEKGVGQHGMTVEPGKGDHWYVRRMQQPDLNPVLNLAMKYKGQKTAYDWELLTLLGLLLIYKEVTPDDSYFNDLLILLKRVVVSLDQLTHQNGVEYFVCSQFVAACFDQAGSSYELDVVNGDLSASPQVTLLDHAISAHGLAESLDGADVLQGVDALKADDIKTFIEAQNSGASQAVSSSDQQQMQQTCDQFLQLFFSMNAAALGLSADDYNTADKRLQLAQRYQADFVTPADLKLHCQNLQDIGMIRFVYGEAM